MQKLREIRGPSAQLKEQVGMVKKVMDSLREIIKRGCALEYERWESSKVIGELFEEEVDVHPAGGLVLFSLAEDSSI